MTIAFWCVLVAGLLPYLASMIAKSERGFDNSNPREWLAQRQGFRARAHAAQLNGFEALPLFAAAVIIAHIKNGPHETANLMAAGFVIARLLYLVFYLGNLATLRSVCWSLGLGCTVSLFMIGG